MMETHSWMRDLWSQEICGSNPIHSSINSLNIFCQRSSSKRLKVAANVTLNPIKMATECVLK